MALGLLGATIATGLISINQVDVGGCGNEYTWHVPPEHAQIDSKWLPTVNLVTECTENVSSDYLDPRQNKGITSALYKMELVLEKKIDNLSFF